MPVLPVESATGPSRGRSSSSAASRGRPSGGRESRRLHEGKMLAPNAGDEHQGTRRACFPRRSMLHAPARPLAGGRAGEARGGGS